MALTAFNNEAALVDLSDRAKLHFKGEQALWFLDQLLTNKLDELEPGTGAEALLLTPKGKIVAPLRVIATGSSAFVDGPPGMGEELKSFFEGRIFTTKVEIRDRTEEFSIMSVLGPRTDELTRAALETSVAKETNEQRDLGLEVPGETEHETTHFGSSVVVRVHRPIRGLDIWVLRERAEGMLNALKNSSVQVASQDEYFELCTAEGTPRFKIDFDESFLPQEAALERAVNFEKGCYLGQESVAMAQRGRVKRRLRHLTFESSPSRGTVIYEGAEAGKVTSVATGPSEGFGIATVKTSVPVGERVEVVSDGTLATALVNDLPGAEEGPRPPSARELREQLNRQR